MGRLAVLAAAAVLVLSGCMSSGSTAGAEKPVIVVAAFGSSYESGQANLNDFDKALREAYPDNEIVWGFTASFIVNKLIKEGTETVFDSEVPVRYIGDTIAAVQAEGVKEVVLVNLMLMVGQEYREAMDIPTRGLNVKYVHPMLYYPENIQNIVNALESEFATDGGATVICAHGNEAYPEYNAELIQMDRYLRENYDNTYLAVMEGTPEFDPVLESILDSEVDHVNFIPLMMTFGDHMSNDVMGDEEDSFKTQIGLPAEAANSLASLDVIQDLVIQKIDLSMSQF